MIKFENPNICTEWDLENPGSPSYKVRVHITAPLYWWITFNSYLQSSSFKYEVILHKMYEKEFARDDFSYGTNTVTHELSDISDLTIMMLNKARRAYLDYLKKDTPTKDYAQEYLNQIICLLPSCYNHQRTVSINSETLKRIYDGERNNKMPEWQNFRKWIKMLPYSWNWSEDDHTPSPS